MDENDDIQEYSIDLIKQFIDYYAFFSTVGSLLPSKGMRMNKNVFGNLIDLK
jgi:hypothetical protein